MIFYSILFAILLNSLCIFTQITLQRYELYLILPNFFLILFCISLELDNFLTLKNANIFVFFSLNRNFALSLALPKILTFLRPFGSKRQAERENSQINLEFYSLIEYNSQCITGPGPVILWENTTISLICYITSQRITQGCRCGSVQPSLHRLLL